VVYSFLCRVKVNSPVQFRPRPVFILKMESLYNSSQTMQLKRKMTLDLDTNSVIKKTKSSLHTPSELLQSPDLQLLTIGTPEMERFILQNQNLPTPNLTSNFFFPKSVTEEQEVYVKGFSDALDRIKQQGQQRSAAYSTLNNNNNNNSIKYEASLSSSSGSGDADDNSILSEDQTSSCYEPSEQAFPSAPINMENQEKIKLERKRQRNRVAASKCRRRKLEKISKLEEKVNQLKRENSDLSGVLNKLKDHVGHLKEQILKHMESGCNIMTAAPGTSNNGHGQPHQNGFA